MYNFIEVVSSNLQALAISGNDLIIKFNSGDIYRYYGAAIEWTNILNASSKGKYFSEFIRNNYNYKKEK